MTTEVIAAIAEMRSAILAEMRAIREEIANQGCQDKRRQTTKRRHELVRQLAAETGLGITQAAATEAWLIWCGTHETPPGCKHVVEELRREKPKGLGMDQIWRILKAKD